MESVIAPVNITPSAADHMEQMRSPSNEGFNGPLPIKYTATTVFQPTLKWLQRNRVLTDHAAPDIILAYKLLRTQVLQLLSNQGWNSLAVLGGRSQDGASLTAINLAISIAMDPRYTVLLCDMNLRLPSVHRYFGYKPENGITDVLAGRVKVADALFNPGIDSLAVLPGNKQIRNSSEVLAAPVTSRFMAEIKSRYPNRILIVDLPPILEAEDAMVFAPHFDAGLLVMREGQSRRDELGRIAELLGDKPLLGTVLNGARR